MLVIATLAILVFGTAMLSPFRLLFHQKTIDAAQILVGLLLLTSFVSILALVGLIQNLFIIAIVCFIFFASLGIEIFKGGKGFLKLFSYGAKLTFYASTAISVFLFAIGYRKFATFMNPDPYGYMALSGGLSKYGSIDAIMNKWSEYTGQIYVQGLSWDEPTKLLPNAWLVPDMVVRYAVDELVNGKRIGLSSLLTPVMQIFDPINAFLVCWLALAIVFIALMTGSLLDVVRLEQDKNIVTAQLPSGKRSHASSRQIEKGQSTSVKPRFSDLFLYLTISAISISSVWILVFLFEGLSSQLCTAAAVVAAFAIAIHMQGRKLRESYFDFIMLFLIVIGTYFIYVQQLPIVILAGLAPFLLQVLKFNRLKIWQKITILFALFASAFAALRFTSLKTYLELIVGSSGHGSIHLGSVNPVKSQFSGLDVFWNSITMSPRAQGFIFQNFLSSGLGIPTSQSGYFLLTSSFLEQVLSIFGVFLLITAYVLYHRVKRNSPTLNAIYLVLGTWTALLLYYLVSHVYLVFQSVMKNPENQSSVAASIFSDYVWLRLIAIYSSFLLIALAVILGRHKVDLQSRKLLFFVGIALFIFSSFTFIKVSNAYQVSSTPGSVAPTCSELAIFDDPIYIYEPVQGSQAILALTLCGDKLSSFSDPFPSKLQADSKKHDVVELVFASDRTSWELKRLGSFTMTEDIQTPCDIVCIEKLPEFQTNQP